MVIILFIDIFSCVCIFIAHARFYENIIIIFF